MTTLYRRYVAALVHFHLAAGHAANLGPTDYQAGSLLDSEGPLTTGDLGRLLRLTPSATTRVVDRLIAAGVAERVPDSHDRRRTIVRHTGVLPAKLTALLQEVRGPIASAVADLSEEQREGLAAYFGAATEVYQRAGNPG